MILTTAAECSMVLT